MAERAGALAVALALDGLAGEVGGEWHPVALMGGLLDWLHRPWRGRGPAVELLGAGAALAAATALAAGLGWAVERLAGRRALGVALAGAALKQTLSARALLAEGAGVAGALERDQLAQARWRLRALVSRPTAGLDAAHCASAAIESMAENLGDSVAAPLLLYAVSGLPAAAAYRVVNTADAMFGYRGETEWLGKPAARLDDALSWVPSRLSALALTGAALLLRGPDAAAAAVRVWRRDGRRTASPNAGRPMAAMAGALGRRLQKPGHYVLGVEFPAPRADDLRAAVLLAGVATGLLAAGALLLAVRR